MEANAFCVHLQPVPTLSCVLKKFDEPKVVYQEWLLQGEFQLTVQAMILISRNELETDASIGDIRKLF